MIKLDTNPKSVGKNKDDSYAQTNVYVPKDLKAAVKIELLWSDGELSDLVETLLRDWLTERKVRLLQQNGRVVTGSTF